MTRLTAAALALVVWAAAATAAAWYLSLVLAKSAGYSQGARDAAEEMTRAAAMGEHR